MALGVWRKYSRGEAHGVEFFVMKQKTLFPVHFAPGRGTNGFMKSTPGLMVRASASQIHEPKVEGSNPNVYFFF